MDVQFAGVVVTGPSGVITRNEGGLGRPVCESKVCRSEAMDGEPNASTMTIVSPWPSIPLENSGDRL